MVDTTMEQQIEGEATRLYQQRAFSAPESRVWKDWADLTDEEREPYRRTARALITGPEVSTDAVSGEALSRAQRIFNAMKDEPDSTGKVAVLAEALEQAQASAEAAMVKAGPVTFTPPDGAVRVLRLLEYVYPDAETMLTDQQRWQVQGTYRPRAGHLIRSVVLPPEVLR